MITSEDLRLFLKEMGIDPLSGGRIADLEYCLTTREFVLGEFSESYRAFNAALGLLQYRPEANDCDDFSDRCYAWAKALFAASHPDKKKTLAVGKLIYINENATGHDLNFFIVPRNSGRARPAAGSARHFPVQAPSRSKGREWELIVYEPQTYGPVTLTWKEIESCYDYSF